MKSGSARWKGGTVGSKLSVSLWEKLATSRAKEKKKKKKKEKEKKRNSKKRVWVWVCEVLKCQNLLVMEDFNLFVGQADTLSNQVLNLKLRLEFEWWDHVAPADLG